MAGHNEFGEKGEELAAQWLILRGFSILQRNWRKGRYEIDIIALQKEVLHFIEVKIRSSAVFGFPEENVGYKKIRNIMKAAAAFLFQYRGSEEQRSETAGGLGERGSQAGWNRIQYDVLAITANKNSEYEYFFFEDVSL